MKLKILIDDKLGRFKKGEIGEFLKNDFPEKYDYFIELPGKIAMPSFLLTERSSKWLKRQYYFYSHEVEIIK